MGKHSNAYEIFVLILFGVFSLPFSGEAQNLIPFELRWKQGAVILTNGDTLRGNVSITLPNDIVRLSQSNGTFATILPDKIQMLEVREAHDQVPYRKSGDLLLDRREYRQYSWNHDKDFGNFKSPALFVVVVPGKYGLLLREERHKQTPGSSGNLAEHIIDYGAGQLVELIIMEKWYLRTPDQKVKLLRNPKDDLLAFFPDKKKAIKEFARQNSLQFNRLDHLARIVAYCNSI